MRTISSTTRTVPERRHLLHAALIQDGTYGGTAYTITLENGGLVMDYNSGYDLPEDVLQESLKSLQGFPQAPRNRTGKW